MKRFFLLMIILGISVSSCESFEEKKDRVLNERIKKCIGTYSDCLSILNKHLDSAVKENVITEKQKESIISLSNYKNNKSSEAFDKGATMLQSYKCATIKCWLQEVDKFEEQKLIEQEKSHLEKGRDLENEKDFTGAMKEFNLAIEQDSNSALAYLCRGAVKRELNDYRGALSDFKGVLKIEPNDSECHSVMGDLYLNMNEYDNALGHFNKVIELGNESVLSNTKMGDNYKKDLIMYAYLSKSEVLNAKGMHSEAIDVLNTLISLIESDTNSKQDFKYLRTSSYLYRGNYKYDFGDENGACLDWSKAGELGKSEVYDIIKEKCN